MQAKNNFIYIWCWGRAALYFLSFFSFFSLWHIESHLKKNETQQLCFFRKFLFMAPALYKVLSGLKLLNYDLEFDSAFVM